MGGIGRNDYFTIEESRALLFAIFPHWPDLRGCRPVPDLKQFLAELRAKEQKENS